MTIKERLESFYQMPLNDISAKIHWEGKVSMNQISKDTGIIRQSITHVFKIAGLKTRPIGEAHRLTPNRGEKHYCYGKTKHDSSVLAKHSLRMQKSNPAKNPEVLARIIASRAKTFRKKPWPAEIIFRKILRQNKVKFIFQYPITPYIIDFYIPSENLCIEVDSTDKWGSDKRRNAKIKDKILKRKGFKVLRINKVWLPDLIKIRDILKTNNVIG